VYFLVDFFRSKKCIENAYRDAYFNFLTCSDENEKFKSMRLMASLELEASTMYGFDFSDSLKNVCNGI
jgi:hypothetical protein